MVPKCTVTMVWDTLLPVAHVYRIYQLDGLKGARARRDRGHTKIGRLEAKNGALDAKNGALEEKMAVIEAKFAALEAKLTAA